LKRHFAKQNVVATASLRSKLCDSVKRKNCVSYFRKKSIMAANLFNSPGNDFYQQHWVLVFPGIGLIFVVLGVIFLMVAKHKRKLRQWLLENGKPVWAKVEGTETNWNIRINGRPATVLVATHGNMRFISDPITNHELANFGEHVKILFHPQNFDRYVFDFDNESPLRPIETPSRL